MFIDSNIFLYAIGDKDLGKQKIAQSIITKANACISVQVINEVSINALKKLNFTEPDLRRLLESCYARYSVLNSNLAIFELASNLRDKYNFSYFDSIIVATAIDGKCETLYSEDMQHGLNVMEQVRIVNPFK